MKAHRLKILSAFLFVAFVAAACTSSPTGRKQMILKSDEDLAAESARQFAEMRASMPLLTDQTTIDYIACVANAIVDVLPQEYKDLPWEMAIFDSDAVNAFAMPGGKIGVMQGILKAAQNQDQLAAVIGHEIAHVTARHANERASRGGMSGVGVQVVAVLLGGGNSGATYTAYEALNAGASLGIMLPFSRSQESEADIIGLDYMAMAGFDPRESAPLWVNMGAEAGAAPAEFISTHPSSENRIDALVSRFGETLAMYNTAQEQGRNPDCEP
jgi:predicted Zn-dependent protease